MHSSAQSMLSDAKRDSVNLLYSNANAGLLVSLIAAAVLIFGFKTNEVQELKYEWWGLFLVCLGLRLIDIIFWKTKLQNTEFDSKWPRIRFILGALLTAVFWSAYGFLISKDADIMELAYTLIIIAGMAGGSATILAGSKILAIGYSSILLIPLSIYFLFFDEIYHQMLGGLGLIFGFVMAVSAIKAANFTQNAIRLKNHNHILVKEMEKEKNEVNRINTELSLAYTKINKSKNILEKEVARRTRQIYQLSNLDPLTQLYNRNAFIHALKQLLARVKDENIRLAILFIDLDGFKQINDALGHEVGDKVLKVVTDRILNFKSKGNVGRWGGDEFILVLPDCNGKYAVEYAQKIVQSISSTINIGSLNLNIGASIGISLSPEHSQDEHQLIQYADIAMYEQKKCNEKNPRIFSNDLLIELQEKESLRIGLRQAIQNNQFFVVYQPIIDATSKSIVGCEALLRWKLNNKLIPPERFIEIAEQSGLIIDIGRWVLLQACSDAKKWCSNKSCKVSVNVSMVQLLDDSFLSTLDDVLEKSQLSPDSLVLEITESTFAENENYIKKLLLEIQARQVGVSIDDFGTGYSSMSQLQSLPFDIIKIDRSFVNNIQSKGKAIINATLFIAKELKCKTVAEGVETQEQADELRRLGADFLQGFLYAKPMKIADLLEFMRKREQTSEQSVLSLNQVK